jgi:hypothetical protein
VTDNLGVVGGGAGNRAGDDAGATDDHTAATVGGGVSNTASGEVSTVSGGGGNLASGAGATIAGGTSNRGKGGHSTVPGGYGNHAGGDFSFAAGERAKVRDSLTVGDSDGDQGTFSWADAQATDFVSTGPNQFLVRASGGVWFGTDSTISFPAGSFLATSTGGYLSTGGTWTNSSDRALKENFQRVDAEALLDKLVGLPISEWNYKKEGRSARHVGPTAQDFRAVFGLGADDKSISTIDPAGIALAAIQELHRRTQMLTEKTREIDELRLRLEQLEAALAERGSR